MERRIQIDYGQSKSSNNKHPRATLLSLMVILAAHNSSAFHSINYPRSRAEITLQSKKTEEISARIIKEESEKEIHHHRSAKLDRRGFVNRSSFIFEASLQVTLWSLFLSGLSDAGAVEYNDIIPSQQQQRMAFNRRPTAQNASLLPATQQRRLLEECLELSKHLQVDSVTTTSTIEQLKSILVDPQVCSSLNYYTPNLTFKKRNERDRRILSDYRKSNQQRLSGDVINAAMNIYTDDLKYSQGYMVQDPEWKKDYIRSNGELPDVQRLIRADMDVRVMYRNQVQIKVDDAAAELYAFGYTNNNTQNTKECANELQQLLQSATVALDQWFGMIDDADVKEAAQTLSGEQI